MTRLPKIGDVVLLHHDMETSDGYGYWGCRADGTDAFASHRSLLGVRLRVSGINGDKLTVDDLRGNESAHVRFGGLPFYWFGLVE